MRRIALSSIRPARTPVPYQGKVGRSSAITASITRAKESGFSRPNGDRLGQFVSSNGVVPPKTNLALQRFNSDGSPDPSFGSGGLVVTDFGEDGAALALLLQADGKVGGSAWTIRCLP